MSSLGLATSQLVEILGPSNTHCPFSCLISASRSGRQPTDHQYGSKELTPSVSLDILRVSTSCSGFFVLEVSITHPQRFATFFSSFALIALPDV